MNIININECIGVVARATQLLCRSKAGVSTCLLEILVPLLPDSDKECEADVFQKEGESWMEPVPDHELCYVPQWGGGDDESVEDVRPCQGVKKLVETVPHMDPRPEHEVCHAPQWD